jgi:2-dehydropantoate 2-reductase
LSADPSHSSIWVLGAGSVGCYVGGCLQAAGVPVVFIGRPRVLGALRTQGLRLSDLDGHDQRLPPSALSLHDAPPALLAPPGLVLLCVKSGATAQAMASLADVMPSRTPVLSLQNGIRNAQVAQDNAPRLQVLAGMVPFNVAERAPGHVHRGTNGQLAAQDDAALLPWLPAFERAGLPLALHTDMAAVQWAKLLLNLNNPVNALSGLPLQQQLLDRGFRRVLAALQREGLAALRAAGITPALLTPLPPQHLPTVLSLPTPLFRVVAARMLKMDSAARSSMADDLALGRATEIDALCGEVVQLARQHGATAPLNEKMVALVKQWPASPQRYSAAALMSALGLSA